MIVSISATNAQEVEQKANGAVLLETIIVTDGLTPVEQQKSGRAFTIISGEELEKNQIRYVADAFGRCRDSRCHAWDLSVGRHRSASAGIENLFNEKYEEVFRYNTQGRAAFIGLRGTF